MFPRRQRVSLAYITYVYDDNTALKWFTWHSHENVYSLAFLSNIRPCQVKAYIILREQNARRTVRQVRTAAHSIRPSCMTRLYSQRLTSCMRFIFYYIFVYAWLSWANINWLNKRNATYPKVHEYIFISLFLCYRYCVTAITHSDPNPSLTRQTNVWAWHWHCVIKTCCLRHAGARSSLSNTRIHASRDGDNDFLW